jgi:hypothetical protein
MTVIAATPTMFVDGLEDVTYRCTKCASKYTVSATSGSRRMRGV